MRYLDFDVDENLKERTIHGEEGFPMVVYLQDFFLNQRGLVIPHWHDEVQFVYITKGEVLFKVNECEIPLETGKALFINAKCIHSAKPLSGRDAEYICINVHPSLICGLPSGRIRIRYVEPFLGKNYLDTVLIDGAESWHVQCLKEIIRIFEAAEKDEYGFEIEMQNGVSNIWLALIRHFRLSFYDKPSENPADYSRLQLAIDFINENYHSKITLSEIAAEARISAGECCRMFKRNLRVSPMEYLINFRVAQSIKLLVSSSKNISEIAHLSGFGSGSYYTKRFRQLLQCTPLEYRREFAPTFQEDDDIKVLD